jgi:hypothetical protein
MVRFLFVISMHFVFLNLPIEFELQAKHLRHRMRIIELYFGISNVENLSLNYNTLVC